MVLETRKVSCGIGPKDTATFPPVPGDLDHLVLYVLSEALFKRLSNHGDLVPKSERTKAMRRVHRTSRGYS
jgi:hypothetical protein